MTATSAELDAPGAIKVGDAERAAPSATDDNLISGKVEFLPCLRHGLCTSSLHVVLPLSARGVFSVEIILEMTSLLLLLLLLLLPLPLIMIMIMIMVMIMMLVVLALMIGLVAVLLVSTEEAFMPRHRSALRPSLRACKHLARILALSLSAALSPLCIGREDLRHSPCVFLTPLVYDDRGVRSRSLVASVCTFSGRKTVLLVEVASRNLLWKVVVV